MMQQQQNGYNLRKRKAFSASLERTVSKQKMSPLNPSVGLATVVIQELNGKLNETKKPSNRRDVEPHVLLGAETQVEYVPDNLLLGTASLPCLTERLLQTAVDHLRQNDPVLVPLIEEHGPPVRLIGKKGNCFNSLAKSIVYQQLSIKAASSIHMRLLAACQCEELLSVDQVLGMQHEQLRSCGLSNSKATYLRNLAEHFQRGRLCDDLIQGLDADALVATLTAVKGIGKWTVDMFAMFHLGRPDILPVGDLGVRRGMQTLYKLKALPDAKDMESVADKWRPYRSVGSYYMWRVPNEPKPKPKPKPKAVAKSKAGMLSVES